MPYEAVRNIIAFYASCGTILGRQNVYFWNFKLCSTCCNNCTLKHCLICDQRKIVKLSRFDKLDLFDPTDIKPTEFDFVLALSLHTVPKE